MPSEPVSEGIALAIYEYSLWKSGIRLICGVDEAGRAPLAGPVTAAAVIMPENCRRTGITDSKLLPPLKREQLAEKIKAKSIAWAIESVDHETIDHINILQASLLAMKKAVLRLATEMDLVLVDGNHLLPDLRFAQEFVIKGDSKSVCIGAASILAKVERDRIMSEYHDIYPHYNFRQNKGYPTVEHRQAIHTHGPCEIHRKSFRLLPEEVFQEALPLER